MSRAMIIVSSTRAESAGHGLHWAGARAHLKQIRTDGRGLTTAAQLEGLDINLVGNPKGMRGAHLSGLPRGAPIWRVYILRTSRRTIRRSLSLGGNKHESISKSLERSYSSRSW